MRDNILSFVFGEVRERNVFIVFLFLFVFFIFFSLLCYAFVVLFVLLLVAIGIFFLLVVCVCLRRFGSIALLSFRGLVFGLFLVLLINGTSQQFKSQ